MMKHLRNKSKAIVTLVLVLTISATFMTYLPTVNAVDVDTYAFLTVSPDPIGVGQTATLVMWLTLMPEMGPAGSWDARWPGFRVIVTKPDDTTQTLGPWDSDAVGSQWTTYIPATVGTYKFQFEFPGWDSALDPYGSGDYYKPSKSSIVELTVQQDPIEHWPEIPLPEDYWERPIEAENREWWQISGNWLGAGCNTSSGGLYGKVPGVGGFNAYTKAPNTAHVVWTKEHAFGGIVGGQFGSIAYYTGQSYETKFKPPIIMNGRLYYNEFPDVRGVIGKYPPGFVCVDLRSGETLWWQNATITLGQLYNYESPNQQGVIPYLWKIDSATNTYHMYDAFTGNYWCTLENASTGSIIFSPNGDMLLYILNGWNNWLAMWNSSKAIPRPAATGTSAWQWRPTYGATYDWRDGIQWNVTVPDVPGMQSIKKISSGVIYASSVADPLAGIMTHVAYDAKTGQEMWVQNRTIQVDVRGFSSFMAPGTMMDGVYTEFVKETMQWYAFDIYNGDQIWGPTEPYENAWGTYFEGTLSAYGRLYTSAYDGRVHCYNLTTGEHLWTYYTGSAGFETPYGHWPFFGGSGFTVADGKIFATTGEHSPTNPLWRGERLHVIDTKTGKGVWSILGWFQSPVVADGYLVILNGYDNQIYCFGKGQTATTVEAPLTAVPLGSSVVIRGTVTDQSAGAKDTPAIADESMTEWMEYLYMQKPIPADAKGVEVTLDAVDPNGNWIHIGKVTSDMSGMFKKMWTPEVPGEYTVIATFEGSESYWASYAETAVGVLEAPAPVEEPEPEEEPAYTAIDLAIMAAVAVAIVIGVVNLWALRKRT